MYNLVICCSNVNISDCASVSKLQEMFLMLKEYELVEQENVVLAANFDDLCDSTLKPYLMKPVHIRGLHSIQIEYTPFAQIE